MAVIQIPAGGVLIPVDIPDFAMEITQQQILDLNRDANVILNQIAANTTQQAQLTNSLVQSTNSTANGLQTILQNGQTQQQQQAQQQKQMWEDFKNTGLRSFSEETFTAQQALAGLVNTVTSGLGGLGLDMLGRGLASFGTAAGVGVSILEKFANGLSLTRRVGVGLGETMLELRQAAGQAGVTLDQFGQLLGTNGSALLSLGETTGEGAMRVGQLTQQFMSLSREAGYFGMGVGDLNQLLLEELEYRRVTTGELMRSDAALERFSQSVFNNIANQEALARMTGEDVRARLAARRELQRNALAQQYMADVGGVAAENLGSLAASLAMYGDMGETIKNAIINSLATGGAVDPLAFAPELAYMGTAFTDFSNNIRNAIDVMDPTEFSLYSAEQASIMARASTDLLGETNTYMAAFGNQTSQALIQMERAASGIDISAESFQNSMSILNGNVDGFSTRISGLTTELDMLSSGIYSLMASLAIGTFGLGGGEPGSAVLNAVSGLNDAIRQQNFEGQEVAHAIGEISNFLMQLAITPLGMQQSVIMPESMIELAQTIANAIRGALSGSNPPPSSAPPPLSDDTGAQ